MSNRFREKTVEEGLGVSQAAPAPEPEEESLQTEPRVTGRQYKRTDRAARGIGRVLGGDLLADRFVVRQIPLLLLCLIYFLLIVGNRYAVERLSREKAATEERINYLREHRIQMQKQYQQTVKISQIADDLKSSGVGITSGPPYEIED